MQWAKAKNIFLIILVAVNLFLGSNLFALHWQSAKRHDILQKDIAVILEEQGVACSDSFVIPFHTKAIDLMIERNMDKEEQFANVLLGKTQRIEDTNGVITYQSQNGSVTWFDDGTFDAKIENKKGAVAPKESELLKSAKGILEGSGVSFRGAEWIVDPKTSCVHMTSNLAGLPVFGRELVISFGKDAVTITGQWSFDNPYARASDQEQTYEAGDALLSFLRKQPEVTLVKSMQFGYQMVKGSAGRLHLAPIWKMDTDKGEFFMNSLKVQTES